MKRHAIVVAFGLLLLSALWFPIQDGDVFFYLSLGRWILENGSIPEADPFLYTLRDWHVHHEWLAYVFFYLAQMLGAWAGVMIMKVMLWIAAFGILVVSARNLGVQDALSFPLFGLTLLVCSHRFIERASLFSDLFLVSMMALFLIQKPPARRWLFALPVLFALWVNFHPGYLIGLALYALYVTSIALETRKIPKNVLLSFGLSILACLANPSLVAGALYPIQKAFSPDWEIHRKINFEWMPTFQQPMLGAWEVWALIFLLVLTASLLSITIFRTRTIPILSCASFGLFLYLAADASRFMSTSALGLTLVALSAISALGLRVPESRASQTQLSLTLFFTAAAVVVSIWGYPSSAGHRVLGTGPETVSFPTEAVERVIRHVPVGRIFNQYEWGSYLIWALDRRDFLFIHTHVDDPRFLMDSYYGMSRSKEIFEQTVRRYDIQYFLLDRKILSMRPAPGLLEFLGGWRVLYQDETAVLWGR